MTNRHAFHYDKFLLDIQEGPCSASQELIVRG
jgi:hypothetical protein